MQIISKDTKQQSIILSLVLVFLAHLLSPGQQLNGEKFTFSKGKTEWSDTIFRKLLTGKMAKKGIPPVMIAIRYKFLKEVDEGKWYEIEVGNRSKDIKIRFNVSTGRNQELFTVKLSPGETKSFRKFYWQGSLTGPVRATDGDDILTSPFEEILQNR